MKKLFMMALVAIATFGSMSCSKGETEVPVAEPQTVEDSISYYLGKMAGVNFADAFKQQFANDSAQKVVAEQTFTNGVKAVLTADVSDTLLNFYIGGVQAGLQMLGQAGPDANRGMLLAQFEEALKSDSVSMEQLLQYNSIIDRLLTEKMFVEACKQNPQIAAMYETNIADGKKFIEEKAKDSNVKTTASGLAYKVVKQGNGDVPTSGQTVEVIYTGKLINGNVFDSSEGKSVPMSVDGVVPGFSEALKLMPVGSKYIIYLPAELAYGKSVNNPAIAPGSTLEFEVEVTSVK